MISSVQHTAELSSLRNMLTQFIQKMQPLNALLDINQKYCEEYRTIGSDSIKSSDNETVLAAIANYIQGVPASARMTNSLSSVFINKTEFESYKTKQQRAD